MTRSIGKTHGVCRRRCRATRPIRRMIVITIIVPGAIMLGTVVVLMLTGRIRPVRSINFSGFGGGPVG